MIYLHKLLPLLVSPLGVIFFLFLCGWVFRRVWIAACGVLVLVVCSLPLTSMIIWNQLEARYPYRPLDNVAQHGAVIVLSGMLGGFKAAGQFVVQWDDPDRFFAAIHLIKAGKADRLIFTRGQMPWSNSPPEGELLKQKAIEMGIDPAKIILTDIVANTADEAREVKKVMEAEGLPSAILVTSSFHMPRAKFLFDQSGVSTEAYATDFRARSSLSWLAFLPSAGAFGSTSSGIREYIGRLYYGV